MIKKEKVSFKVKKQKLAGTLLIPEGISSPVPGVVFYHGKDSSQKGYIPRAEVLTKCDIICLTFDFRGRGESEGDFSKLTNNDGLADTLAGFDFLLFQDKVDKNRIGICGASFGGYLASLVSSKRKVKSMVLRAPATYKNSWSTLSWPQISNKFARFLKSEGVMENLAFQSIRKFKGSLLIIGSEKDETIPAEVVRAYSNHAVLAKEKKLVFIKNATHKLINQNWNQEFINLTTNWFKKTL